MDNYPLIEIDDFIFHVVHNGPGGPTLMDATPLGEFSRFFIDRINDVLKGNSFSFKPESDFLNRIRGLDRKEIDFVQASKEFASSFHSKDKRIKPGVMILMRVKIDTIRKYVLLKYDHEEVVHYKAEGHRALLYSISNTFSKNPDALQKSAIIDIISDSAKPVAVVIDKSEREYITDFFREFLGIVRVYSNEDLTEKVRDCFRNTVKYYKKELPEEITSQVSQKFVTAAKNNKNFEPGRFIQAAIGPYFLPEMEDKFRKELKARDIEGEAFLFKDDIQPPAVIKYKTAEGVLIRVPEDASDTIKITREGEKTIIRITTANYLEE